MKLADKGSLIDHLYQDWQRHVDQLRRDRDALRATGDVFVYSQDYLDMLTEDVTLSAGRAQGSEWALATVLQAAFDAEQRGITADLHAPVRNWTYGSHLAHDYHVLYVTHRHRMRLADLAQPAVATPYAIPA